MKHAGLLLLHLAVLVSGCATETGYVVHFQSQDPFHPDDPNELLVELTTGLPAGFEIQHFLYQQKPDEMRGIVLVRGSQARDLVRNTIRASPRLRLAGVGAEKAHTGGKFLICFTSQPPFAPAGEDDVLAQLQRSLPSDLKPAILRSKHADGRIVLWVSVKGNFGKEAVKFAIRRNPNLKLLQVENMPLVPLLLLGAPRKS